MTIDELMDGKYVHTESGPNAKNDVLLVEISVNQDDQDLKSTVKALEEAVNELWNRSAHINRRQPFLWGRSCV